MSRRALVRSLGLLGLAVSLSAPALARDARVLDDAGRVLTVGSWALVPVDGGHYVRVADQRFLGWELRDENGLLLGQGLVPGSESLGVDATPSLSRNPQNGDIWLAWSRQADSSLPREIALLKFAAAAWATTEPQVIASDSDDQLEPALVHDESGRGWMAWIDGGNTRTVKFLGLTADGRVAGTETLSEGLSERNGAPSIGIDALGNIFVAHAGFAPGSTDAQLFVLTPSSIPGGVSHVPNPIIDLGLRATLPAPTMGQVEEPGMPAVPGGVNLTVLGGTPVAWWTETEAGDLARFRYAAEGAEGWHAAVVRTIDLQSGMVASVPDALALVEARLRRVIDQHPGASVPVVPGTPGSVPSLGRSTDVRHR